MADDKKAAIMAKGDDANERTRRLWERYAPRYDRQIARSERLLFPDGRAWACSQASGDVLEVAVGTGLNLAYYPEGTAFTGVDLSPAMLAIARDRAKELGVDANLREASAGALPFPDASFDTVVCTVSLCNIPGDRAAIDEMYRVLRRSGQLILLDHVASDRRWVLAIERLLEPLTLRLNGDYLTRRPLPRSRPPGSPSSAASGSSSASLSASPRSSSESVTAGGRPVLSRLAVTGSHRCSLTDN